MESAKNKSKRSLFRNNTKKHFGKIMYDNAEMLYDQIGLVNLIYW